MAAEFREDEMNSENSQSSLLNRAISNESMSNSTTEKEDVVTDQRSIHLILEGCNSKEGLNFEVNLQPEKIVEVFNLPDGTQSYRVRWKDTWIHEQLITSYQHLVEEFWQDQNKQNDECLTKKIDFDIEEEKPAQSNEEVKVILLQPNTNDDENGNAKEQSDEELNFEGTPDQPDDDDPANHEENDVKEESDESPKSRKRKATSSFKRSGKKFRCRPKKTSDTRKSTKKQAGEEEKENKDEDCTKVDNIGQASNDESSKPEGLIQPKKEEGTSKQRKARDKKDKFLYPDDKGPCTCDICGKVISNKYGLREHQTVVHFKNGRFECEICGKRVTNKRALNLHMTSHSTERKFVCDQCGSSHKTKGNLNYHIKTMHTMIKNFRCDICFKTFKVQAELKDHCFSVHANAGVITCIVCKKKLTTSLSIYTHSVMHSGAREYECDICGYAFKTVTGLKEHKVTHSDNKPIRQCPYCERKFFSRSQYNAHVMRHTADGSLITYKCPMCEVKFQHKSSYNRHVIRHQPGGDLEFPKENPYLLLDEADLPEGVCHKCRKYYSSKSGFYLHLKKCRDGIIQQFPCPYCERGCSNRSSLKRHIERRHKGMEFEGRTIQSREIQKEDSAEATVISQQDGMQYPGTYFDVSQLPAVDVQLLIDTATAQGDGQTAHILSNIGQVTQGEENGQNLHILSSHEAAQFAAQLTQHGVIVRSSDVSHGQGQDQQQLIVSSAQIDARTGQIIVSEGQTTQIIGNAEALGTTQLANETSGLTLQADDRNLLQDENVLQFNNRTAVIRIQHNPADTIGNQQVLTITDQHLQDTPVQLQGHINNENVSVTELQSSTDINDINADNIDEQQFIQEEQIVSNLTEGDVEHAYDGINM